MKVIKATIASLALALSLTSIGGCSSSDGPVPVDNSNQEAEDSDHAVLWASEQTTAAFGIAEWRFVDEDHELLILGVDTQGVERGHIAMRTWNDNGAPGKELVSSEGGILRVTADGEITELETNDDLFTAFAYDSESAELEVSTETFRGCSSADWISCMVSVGAAIDSCGSSEDVKCVSALLGVGTKCFKCYKNALDRPTTTTTGGGGGGCSGIPDDDPHGDLHPC